MFVCQDSGILPTYVRTLTKRLNEAGPNRRDMVGVDVRLFNTPRGTIRVSTPEATAFDLVAYAHHIGGLDQAATILAELAEQIDPEQLRLFAETVPVPWAQRLGYLLDFADVGETASPDYS